MKKRMALAGAVFTVHMAAGVAGAGFVNPYGSPQAYSYVSGSTTSSGNVLITERVNSVVVEDGYNPPYLTYDAIQEDLPINTTHDSASDSSYSRGALVGYGRDFSQWNSSLTYLEGKAQSDWGVNRAGVVVSGQLAPDRIKHYEVGQLSGIDSNGSPVDTDEFGNPVPETTIEINRFAGREASAYSRWEDIFVFTGGTGTGSVTFNLTIEGSISAGNLWYRLRDWEQDHQGDWYQSLAHLYSWELDPTAEFGPGTTFSRTIPVTMTFSYGEALYLKSELWNSLWEEGVINMMGTAKIDSIDVPAGTVVDSLGVFLQGGGGYGVSGGTMGDGGGFTGGGGGGGPAVPVPGAIWLLGSGLATLVRLSPRKGR